MIFYTIVISLIALIAVFLTLVVLMQSGQGSGLSGMAAGGSSTQMMGSRRTADILSKSTSILGGSFLALCVIANLMIPRDSVTRSTIQSQGAAPLETQAPSQTNSALPIAPAQGTDANSGSDDAGSGDGN